MSVNRVEVVVRSWRNAVPLPLQSCDSWIFMNENPDRNTKMLIIVFRLFIFGQKMTGKSWASTHNWVPTGIWLQCHNHSPQIVENTLPRPASSFSKMWKCPQFPNSYRLTLWWPLGLHNTSLDPKFRVQNFSFSW